MNHGKKMIAPIVVAAIIIIIIASYIRVALFLAYITGIPMIVRIVIIAVPLILAAVMFGVLISRIKEIKGGEEDDLSQY
ncbi:MAG: hypothetical protein K2N85_03140 [Lachnospiraceae bacterium]|nr:hypothetical protein [Lachnospiraceae bacterium]